MQKIFHPLAGFVLALLLTSQPSSVNAASNSGLWVGEIILNKVNEAVSGINASNQVVATDPALPTPVKSPAHLKIIFHVDASGKVNLLKGVAIVNKSTNGTPDIALISDPNLYQKYGKIAAPNSRRPAHPSR